MYAITGITGNVGGAMGRALIDAGQSVRAVVRDAAKGREWADKGCEVAIADMDDTDALAAAFAGAEGVFILPPSDFDPEPGYPAAKRIIAAVKAALIAARPDRVLCLSTVGADATTDNLLSQRTLMEEALGDLDMPVTFLRPGWFLENVQWDVPSARDEGVLHSYLQPADRRIPMVSSEDVGRTAAILIQEKDIAAARSAPRIVELEGPARVSPDDIAAAFAAALGRPVRVEIVPRADWEGIFRAQGMQHPGPRMRMVDGFNQGWIAFPNDGRDTLRGKVTLADVVAKLVAA